MKGTETFEIRSNSSDLVSQSFKQLVDRASPWPKSLEVALVVNADIFSSRRENENAACREVANTHSNTSVPPTGAKLAASISFPNRIHPGRINALLGGTPQKKKRGGQFCCHRDEQSKKTAEFATSICRGKGQRAIHHKCIYFRVNCCKKLNKLERVSDFPYNVLLGLRQLQRKKLLYSVHF